MHKKIDQHAKRLSDCLQKVLRKASWDPLLHLWHVPVSLPNAGWIFVRLHRKEGYVALFRRHCHYPAYNFHGNFCPSRRWQSVVDDIDQVRSRSRHFFYTPWFEQHHSRDCRVCWNDVARLVLTCSVFSQFICRCLLHCPRSLSD